MWPVIPSTRRIGDFKLTNFSGFVSNTSGGATFESPLVELIIAVLLGALAGLVVGFIVSGVLRYCSMIMMGRHISGVACTLYSSLAGGLVFGLLAILDEE